MLSLWEKVTLYERYCGKDARADWGSSIMEPGKRSSRRSVVVEVEVDCGVRRRRAQSPSSSTLEAEFAASTKRGVCGAVAAAAAELQRPARRATRSISREAGMAAFEARVAALNSQIEAATAEQRPETSDPSV